MWTAGLDLTQVSPSPMPPSVKTSHPQVSETGNLILAAWGSPSAQCPHKAVSRALEIFPNEKSMKEDT